MSINSAGKECQVFWPSPGLLLKPEKNQTSQDKSYSRPIHLMELVCAAVNYLDLTCWVCFSQTKPNTCSQAEGKRLQSLAKTFPCRLPTCLLVSYIFST